MALDILPVAFDLALSPSPSLMISDAGSVATLCSTILGAPFSPCFLEFFAEVFLEVDEGDGDFNLGEMGHEGVSFDASGLLDL
jgi:hypothetical protein